MECEVVGSNPPPLTLTLTLALTGPGPGAWGLWDFRLGAYGTMGLWGLWAWGLWDFRLEAIERGSKVEGKGEGERVMVSERVRVIERVRVRARVG